MCKSDIEDFRVGGCALDLKKIIFVVVWGVLVSLYFCKVLAL